MARRKTWYDRILAYLLAHNYKEVTGTRHQKYKVFRSTVTPGESRLYLLGTNGAVRRQFEKVKGRPTISVTDIFKKYTVLWEMENDRRRDLGHDKTPSV